MLILRGYFGSQRPVCTQCCPLRFDPFLADNSVLGQLDHQEVQCSRLTQSSQNCCDGVVSVTRMTSH